MKKIYSLIILLCVLSINVQAQLEYQADEKIPVDDKIVQGKLSNGLKYYILKNQKPANRAELRLVLNAGSLMEDADQQGLAHFVEHMAFNGTKNFKKQELISYLESVGTKFGAHLNAYTSFDETVYMLQIPTDDQEVYQKSFQILEDWSHNLAFENKEIDKERGVVIEEWRLGLGADDRMNEKIYPVIFKDSRYAERLPIGKKEILEEFDYETLKRFYKDWYRPDLMAVVVVGDVDIEATEQLIKKHFDGLQNPANPRPRQVYDIPKQKGLRVVVATDKEAWNANLNINYYHDKKFIKTQKDLRDAFIRRLATSMVSNRLSDYTTSANPAFSYAWSYYGGYLRTKESYTLAAYFNATQMEMALRTLLIENKRAYEHGFVDTELDRVKKSLLKNYENSFKEKDKTKSRSLIRYLVSHFLEGDIIPSNEYSYEFAKTVMQSITKAEVEQAFKKLITNDDLTIVVQSPLSNKDNLLSEQKIKDIYAEIKKQKVEPYKDIVVDKPLISHEIKDGLLIRSTQLLDIDAVELTFSNGATVVYKQTDHNDNQIRFGAISKGGYSTLAEGETEIPSVVNAAEAVSSCGLGKFTPTELQKKLSGKSVYIEPYISMYSEGVYGATTTDDLETAMQLMYLRFTSPRPDHEAFKAFISKSKTFIQNDENNPNMAFYNKVRELSYNGSEWKKLITSEDYDELSISKCMETYIKRFSNADNFTFYFVGSLDPDVFTKYATKYIGSLPGKLRTADTYVDMKIAPKPGVNEEIVYKGSEPKSSVLLRYCGKYNKEEVNSIATDALQKALSIQLRNSLREDEGGVYGVNVYITLSKIPTNQYIINISYGCAPENVEKLRKVTDKVIKKLIKKGPTEEDLQKFKETAKRDRELNEETNNFWVSVIKNQYYKDDKFVKYDDFIKKVDALTIKDVQAAAKLLFNQKQKFIVILKPENKP